MRWKKSLWLVPVLIGILLLWPGPAKSVVKSGYKKIIEIAFANGYVEALKLDDEEIRKLKSDNELLKETVKKAADAYLVKVSKMNG